MRGIWKWDDRLERLSGCVLKSVLVLKLVVLVRGRLWSRLFSTWGLNLSNKEQRIVRLSLENVGLTQHATSTIASLNFTGHYGAFAKLLCQLHDICVVALLGRGHHYFRWLQVTLASLLGRVRTGFIGKRLVVLQDVGFEDAASHCLVAQVDSQLGTIGSSLLERLSISRSLPALAIMSQA